MTWISVYSTRGQASARRKLDITNLLLLMGHCNWLGLVTAVIVSVRQLIPVEVIFRF